MNKQEYYKISQQQGLPNRCPILRYCQRHIHTIFFFGEYADFGEMEGWGEFPDDYNENKILFSGEAPEWSKGPTHGHFAHMCPEVNLFDSAHAFP
jgi:hypothetical protein